MTSTSFGIGQAVLVDTTVVSDLMKPNCNPKFYDNIFAYPADAIFISAITVHEILYGIANMDNGQRKREKEVAAANIMKEFQGGCLPIDAEIAGIAAQLRGQKKKQGRDADKLELDMFIAATALRHNMSLFTSNTKDFLDTSHVLRIFDPRTKPA